MSRTLKLLRWLRLGAAALLAASAACSSTNPAAPPSPPAEIPSLVTFPQSLSIDVDKIRSEAAVSGLLAQVLPDGEFSDAISGAAEFADIIGDTVDSEVAALNELFDALQVPVSPGVTTFKKTLSVDDEGKLDPNGSNSLVVKIDFGRFDADHDGEVDACTGCTCPTGCTTDTLGACEGTTDQLRPVCFQVWEDFIGVQPANTPEGVFRLVSGRFDRLRPSPSAASAIGGDEGAGRFVRELTPNEPFTFVGAGVIYDHPSDEEKLSELFVRSDPVPPGAEGSLFDNIHVLIAQEGPDDAAFKSLRVSVEGRFPEQPDSPGNGDFKYVGQWLEDNNFWSGSVLDTHDHPDSLESFENACAVISTGEATPRADCVDLDIDVGGVPFIDFTTAADVTYSTDFLEVPTF